MRITGASLMELHTLGVDGGYTQKDVTEVARCFTGWTIEKPRENPAFKFDDSCTTRIRNRAGKKIHAGGKKRRRRSDRSAGPSPQHGEVYLHRAGAALCSDTPPPALVSAHGGDVPVAGRRHSRGDAHDDLFAGILVARSYRAKIKTPYELVISAVRTLGTDVDTPMPLVQWVSRIGERSISASRPPAIRTKGEPG